jgi:DNA-binding PadR family transcriptional regulator
MGHRGFRGFEGWVDQPGSESFEQVRRMHGGHGGGHGGGRGRGGRGPWGDWAGAGGPGWQGRQGPPPWVAGLFGLGQPERGRGPRVRRGDVRAAILDVLGAASAEEPLNGYQVIQDIERRSGGAWKPSPGSVYPTVQQLQDEGLVAADDERGRKTLGLTDEGRTYVAEHRAELDAVWAPVQREAGEQEPGFSQLKPEIGQVMGAVWQIVTAGSEQQQRAAIEVLVETRRRLYGILADGDQAEVEGDETEPETETETGTQG